MKILWDVPILTDRDLVVHLSDISFQDKGKSRLYLIEMSVAWDSILAERRAEKLSKYDNLQLT